MRKLAIAIVAIAALGIPVSGLADDIDNANQCKARGDGVHTRVPLVDTDEPDRGSGCINYNGTQVGYMGGEISSENNGGMPCGAVVILDEEITPDGDPNFDPHSC